MFAAAPEASGQSVVFNSLMQRQILNALFAVQPAVAANFCLWVVDDKPQPLRTQLLELFSRHFIVNPEFVPHIADLPLPPAEAGLLLLRIAENEMTPPETLRFLSHEDYGHARIHMTRNLSPPPHDP